MERLAQVLDPVLAVVAMLIAIRPLMQGGLGDRSHLSWRRAGFLFTGGLGALIAAVGLLALRSTFFEQPFFLPTWVGASLAFFGGMLGAATVLAGRGPGGMSESAALRLATQAGAMTLYVASPLGALLFLGVTRLGRAGMPWTYVRRRWVGVGEGVLLIALALVPRDDTVGGLRRVVSFGSRPTVSERAASAAERASDAPAAADLEGAPGAAAEAPDEPPPR